MKNKHKLFKKTKITKTSDGEIKISNSKIYITK